ncbi:MAG: TonB-dependent receptor [Campylobacterota bacterium]|nr:TonB-dependent receptor [Campylobacterota bacterium]
MKKKTISISLALLLSSAVYAQEMKELEVVSIATKTAKSIDGVAASVEVITQEQIERMGAESLKDIISKTPGIDIQYGTFPSASATSKSSVSIRGMSANGTLFLLDGRRVAGEVANPYDLDRIPASIIQRVEIVKGPNSSLYGADAVGGVINIITKKATDELKIDANARYGANEHGEAQNTHLDLSIQGKNSGFGYSAYAGYTTTTPYTQNEIADVYLAKPVAGQSTKAKPSSGHPFINPMTMKDYYATDVTYREESEIYTLGGRISYDFTSDFVMGMDVNYFNEEREGVYIGYFHPTGYKTPNAGIPPAMRNKPIPAYNIPVNSKDENHRLDLSVDMSYAPTDELEIKARVYNSSYEKRNTTTAKEFLDMGYASEEQSAKNGMNADVDITVGELMATYLAGESNLITGGVEYRDEERRSSVFTQGSQMTEKKVKYKSIYIQDELEVSEEFNTIFGARYEDISNAENRPTFRVGGVYEFTKLAKLRANFGQGFRTPDIREMYIHKQTPNGLQIGADVMGYDLKPESTNAFELGLGGNAQKFRYDIVGFYNQIDNMIAQTMGTFQGKSAYTFENIADAKTYGMELSLNYRFMENLGSRFFYTELRTENEKTKKDLEFHPERTFMLGFDYQPTSDLTFELIGKYTGQQHYTKVTSRGAPTEKKDPNAKTEAFSIVDLTLGYEISKNFELYGGVNNIADEKVEDVLGSSVGRYYFAGARVSF